MINAHGTYTIITGSTTLPEVKRAMDEASRGYVNMDELMDAVGKRLAELTGAEWGIVTAGCSAAITHATAAAIAGGNPERIQRLPDLTGLKNEVVVPEYSRNVYDHAARMVGVKLVVVHDRAELERAFNERTAMAYILAGPGDEGPLGTRVVAEVAKAHGVPLVVDAAAEILTMHPNVHLERGAAAVAYSGGKCIRGPQAAGLLLGEKSLVQTAWVNSAPHHGFGRSLKVGKEEIMGMLAAVEMWVKRDHKAEWAQWEAWLQHIAAAVTRVDGVTTKVIQPEGLSNRTPTLEIRWDPAKLGISGNEVHQTLLNTEPRIILHQPAADSVGVNPYMMAAGDEKVVADRLYAILSKPPKIEHPVESGAAAADVAGEWNVRIEFVRGAVSHTIQLKQDGKRISGSHRGEFASGELSGTVAGNAVRFRSSYPTLGTRVSYQFSGALDGGRMSGVVKLDEYGEAHWSASKKI
jgi:L-seryl-tRNA(Ser) seleniumtransferase